jgi:hypothetical protein
LFSCASLCGNNSAKEIFSDWRVGLRSVGAETDLDRIAELANEHLRFVDRTDYVDTRNEVRYLVSSPSSTYAYRLTVTQALGFGGDVKRYYVVLGMPSNEDLPPDVVESILGPPVGSSRAGTPVWLMDGHLLSVRNDGTLWWHSIAFSSSVEDYVNLRDGLHLPSVFALESSLHARCTAETQLDTLLTFSLSHRPFDAVIRPNNNLRACLVKSMERGEVSVRVGFMSSRLVDGHEQGVEAAIVSVHCGYSCSTTIGWGDTIDLAKSELVALGVSWPEESWQMWLEDWHNGYDWPNGIGEWTKTSGNLVLGLHSGACGSTVWRTFAVWRRVNANIVRHYSL